MSESGKGSPGARAIRRLPASGVGPLAALAAALIQLAPLLGRGYVLVRDMVFAPTPPLSDQLLGVRGLPRAVPSDLIVALLSHVLPGDVVQDLILLATLTMAGWGAGRLVPVQSRSAVAASAVFASWNPFVAERLRQGQWAVLVGYAAIPWAARAAIDWRSGRAGSAGRMALATGIGAMGGASAELLIAIAVAPLLVWPGGNQRVRRGLLGLGVLAVFSLPWLIPSLTQPSAYPVDRVGARLFAAQPDTPFGSIGSLLSLGGIWNRQVWLPGRHTVIVGLASLVMTGVALVALSRARTYWSRPTLAALVVGGSLSLGLSAWGSIPGARGLLRLLVADVPGGGLLRDGQRSLAPFVILVAIGFGLAVDAAVEKLAMARVLVIVPALLLPAAAWASDGALTTTQWPTDWAVVAAATNHLPAGPVLVLPWSSVRSFGWNARRPLADPTSLLLRRRVVTDDALDVGGVSTPLEDPSARRIAAVAAVPTKPIIATLRAQGYRAVLLDVDQPGSMIDALRLSALPVIRRTPTLVLYAVPDSSPVEAPRAPISPALAGEILAAVALTCAAGNVARTARRAGSPCMVPTDSPCDVNADEEAPS